MAIEKATMSGQDPPEARGVLFVTDVVPLITKT
jgi:hypothetical protein